MRRTEVVSARRAVVVAAGHRQMLQENAHLRLVDAVLRLDREHVVAPPRAASPVRHSLPRAGMLLHVGQHSVEGRQTRLIGGDADLAEEQMIPGRFRPLRDRGQALDADRCRDRPGVGAATVRVEILMHLEREIMCRILNASADHRGVVGGRPGPGAVPIAARHQDFLRHRAGGADRRDGGVRRANPCARRLIMGLVHQPEHDVRVRLEVKRQLAPQIRKGRIGCLRASDQCAEAVAVIVRLDFDLKALAGRIVHHVVEPPELSGVEWSLLGVLDAFPQER